jgi:hypothetical protein
VPHVFIRPAQDFEISEKVLQVCEGGFTNGLTLRRWRRQTRLLALLFLDQKHQARMRGLLVSRVQCHIADGKLSWRR